MKSSQLDFALPIAVLTTRGARPHDAHDPRRHSERDAIRLHRDRRTQRAQSSFQVISRTRLSLTLIAPIVNVVMLNLAYLVVGVVVVEAVSSPTRAWASIWSMLVAKRDVPVVHACRP